MSREQYEPLVGRAMRARLPPEGTGPAAGEPGPGSGVQDATQVQGDKPLRAAVTHAGCYRTPSLHSKLRR